MQEYIDANTPGRVKHIQYFDNVSEHTYTVQNAWNSADANIVGDVAAMCGMLDKRGLSAADLIIGSDVADVFYKDNNIATLLDKSIAYNFGAIDETIKAPGVSFFGVLNFRGHRLNVFCVSSEYEDENDVTKTYFPSDAVMVTFPKCGRLSYGAVTLIPYGSADFETIAKPRVAKLVVDNAHNSRELQLSSRPIAMPRLYTPYIVANQVVK